MDVQQRHRNALTRTLEITEKQADVLIEAGLEVVGRVRAADADVLLALGFSQDEKTRIKRL
jgi:hypothetical protein